MTDSFFEVIQSSHEKVTTHLYDYLADEGEPIGIQPKNDIAPFSVYIYDPMCLSHFSQMLTFYDKNSNQRSGKFIKYLKKEGILTPKPFNEVTHEDVVKWMQESHQFYKATNQIKLCVCSNLQLVNLPTHTLHFEKIKKKFNSPSVLKFLDELYVTLKPGVRSPDSNGLIQKGYHRLDAFIVFKKETPMGDYDFNFKNAVGECLNLVDKSDHYYGNFIENITKKAATPYFVTISRFSILKTKKPFIDPYHLARRTEPTIKLGLSLLKAHSYDMVAACYSFQVLWTHFQLMMASAGILSYDNKIFPNTSVDFTQIRKPEHFMGFILRNMKRQKTYKKFLLMEFFPLLFYIKMNPNDILQRLTHTVSNIFYEEGIAWTKYLQRLSFLHAMDDTISDKLQFLTCMGFKNLQFDKDCFITMVDQNVLFGNVQFYKKINLTPLDESLIKQVTFSEKMSVRGIYYALFAQLCGLLRYTTMHIERTKLWRVTEDTHDLIHVVIVNMLKTMSLLDFYNKNNAEINTKIKENIQLEYSPYLSKESCLDYPFYKSFSTFTHVEHNFSYPNLIKTMFNEYKKTSNYESLNFYTSNHSHFVFKHKDDFIKFNFYFKRDPYSGAHKISNGNYGNTLPKQVFIEKFLIDKKREKDMFMKFKSMIDFFNGKVGKIHIIIKQHPTQTPTVSNMFDFSLDRLRMLKSLPVFLNRFEKMGFILITTVQNNQNLDLIQDLNYLKSAFSSNNLKKPWRTKMDIFDQFKHMLAYKNLFTSNVFFKAWERDTRLIDKIEYCFYFLQHYTSLSTDLFNRCTFMFLD